MYFETYQFGSFDGLDNRKRLLALFKRLGRGLTDAEAAAQRAGFLQALIDLSTSGMAGATLLVTPCSAVEAYHVFVMITGCLGVDVTEAAELLEAVVRKLEDVHSVQRALVSLR